MPDTIACPAEKKPSNTSYLSGDNWELSGCSLSSLQLIAVVEFIAQTLAPVKAGDWIKRNRRDALKLVCGHRSGDLTAVWIPGSRSEAHRDLRRAREAAEPDQLRAWHHLSTFLLRIGSGQGLTDIARYRADFGGNHCGEVGQYLG
jgi:hypothetical protein